MIMSKATIHHIKKPIAHQNKKEQSGRLASSVWQRRGVADGEERLQEEVPGEEITIFSRNITHIENHQLFRTL